MGAYNRTNGEPCCGSVTLMQELLEINGALKVIMFQTVGKDFHENME